MTSAILCKLSLVTVMLMSQAVHAERCYEPSPSDEDDVVEDGYSDVTDDLSEPSCPIPDPGRNPRPVTPPPPPPKVCAVLYRDAGLGGPGITITDDNRVDDMGVHLYERRKWRGSLLGYSGSDKSFNDDLSSLSVNPGCKLDVWTDASYQGVSRTFGGSVVGEFVGFLGDYGLDNTISSVTCSCQVDPPPIPAMILRPVDH